MIGRALLGCLLAVASAAPSSWAETLPIGPIQIEIPAATDTGASVARAGGVDRDMAACTDAETAAWDKRLNAAFGRLRKGLAPADFARLQAAQRGWLAYRNHECALDPDGGTAAFLAAASCALRLTAIRAAELDERVKVLGP